MTDHHEPQAATILLGTQLLAPPGTVLWDALTTVYGSLPEEPVTQAIGLELRAMKDGSASIVFPDGRSILGRGVDARSSAAAAAFGLFHDLAKHVTDRVLLHAAALQIRDRTILIAAPSRVGKTTLTVALALRGAIFLSDEAAPISRRSREVAPFPRAVGLRVGPLLDERRLATAVATAPRVDDRGGRTKYLVDLVASGLVKVGSVAPVDDVVLLESPRPEPSETTTWTLDLDRESVHLAESLRRVPGVRTVVPNGESSAPSLRIETTRGVPLATAIDEASRRASVTVVRFHEGVVTDFDREPTLGRLESVRGIMSLVRHVENGPSSRLLAAELGGSAPRLVVELADLLGSVRFWALTPGRLERMCELVERLP